MQNTKRREMHSTVVVAKQQSVVDYFQRQLGRILERQRELVELQEIKSGEKRKLMTTNLDKLTRELPSHAKSLVVLSLKNPGRGGPASKVPHLFWRVWLRGR